MGWNKGGIMDPKILPSALRSNKRYLVFKLSQDTEISKKVSYSDLHNAVWNIVIELFGDFGASESKLWFIRNLYNENEQTGIIKCSHNFVEKLRLSLSFIKVVGESRVIIQVLGVSGTIKSAKAKYLKHSD